MRRLPSFSALRAFEAAARLGSFAAASDELHLSPSAVSHQVRALEQHFGRRLFSRANGQGVKPNPDGRLLLARLTPALDELEAACAALDPASAAVRGLAVHCAPSFAAKWLGPRLPAFMAAHPEIAIRMTASADPVDLARRSDVEVLIAYGTTPTGPGIAAEPLGTERVTALCAPALAATLEGAGPGLPATLTLIESAVSPVRWEEWLALNGLAVQGARARPSFDRAAMAIAAAAQGVGAVLESTRLAADELAGGTLVELGGGRFRAVRRVLHVLAYRTAQADAPAVAAFRSWLLPACAAGAG